MLYKKLHRLTCMLKADRVIADIDVITYLCSYGKHLDIEKLALEGRLFDCQG